MAARRSPVAGVAKCSLRLAQLQAQIQKSVKRSWTEEAEKRVCLAANACFKTCNVCFAVSQFKQPTIRQTLGWRCEDVLLKCVATVNLETRDKKRLV